MNIPITARLTLNDEARLTLARGTAELWLCRIAPGLREHHFSPFVRDLSRSEMARCSRYRFESGRVQCLLTRVLIRRILSYYSDVDPSDWEFVAGPYGKPALGEKYGDTQLTFNLSHTDGMIACVVGRGNDVGVDVENHHRTCDYQNVAEYSFTEEEARRIAGLDENAARDMFFSLWTLKESYLKAVGCGLSYGLDKVTFDIDKHGRARLLTPQDGIHWRFYRLIPSLQHMVAVCIKAEHGEANRDLSVREMIFSH